jgi:hypothetical protein
VRTFTRRVASGGSGGTIPTRRRTLVSRYAMSMPRHSRGPPWNGMYVKGLGGVRNLGSRARTHGYEGNNRILEQAHGPVDSR